MPHAIEIGWSAATSAGANNGASPEFWGEPLSAEDMLPIIPITDTHAALSAGTLEITGTIVTITTTLPVTSTNLEQDGGITIITATETISPTEDISGTGWVNTKILASMMPPWWLMKPSALNGGSSSTSLVMNIEFTLTTSLRASLRPALSFEGGDLQQRLLPL